MTPPRPARRFAPVWAVVLPFVAAGPVVAADPAWDTARTTSPANLADLKALQERVKGVVTKCSPATVGLFVGMGAGSGVIVSEDGLVLTAAHVSGEPGKTCTVVLPDGKRVKAKSLGRDERLDSGMVQITDPGPDDGKWPYLPLAKSAGLKKGQWVVALGHPGGFTGDRPPVARLGQVQASRTDTLLTNCTLVGGDSGGPLFDLDGNVIGIHSQIAFKLDNNIHVPADTFKTQWEQLAAGEAIGKPAKAFLGVEFDDEGAAGGAKLKAVDEGPASAAGLEAGDVIVKFGGREVADPDAVRAVLKRKKPGDKVEAVVKRGAETVTLTVTLGER